MKLLNEEERKQYEQLRERALFEEQLKRNIERSIKIQDEKGYLVGFDGMKNWFCHESNYWIKKGITPEIYDAVFEKIKKR